MFRLRKTLDVITLFHKASSPASVQVANLLKQASSKAAAGSTPTGSEFELNITEDPPTADQVKTILGYVGTQGIPSIIEGARNEQEALRKFAEDSRNFQRPVVVDWSNGKAQQGENESAILTMINGLFKKEKA